MEDFEVEIETDKGENFELIFSETFSLFNKTDKIKIKLPKKFNNWIYEIQFINDESKNKDEFGGNVDLGLSTISFTYYNWETEAPFIESLEPYIASSQDNSLQLYSRIRTSAANNSNFRSVTFSIWKKQI